MIARRQRPHHVIQGAFLSSDDPDVELTSVLGSCVAACFYDPVAAVGGMNHFLLPEGSARSSNSIVFGAQSMEVLINDLLKRGAKKERLLVKLFGGANVASGLTDIGKRNADFALKFVKDEGISCISSSLYGKQARRVRFFPTTGRAGVKFISDVVVEKPVPPKVEAAGSVELF